MSGPTSRVINNKQYPGSNRVISECKVFEDVHKAANQYGPRLTFNLSGQDMIDILSNQPDSPDLQKLIDKLLKIAENKVDKRGIEKQREIRDKYQQTHGLILKNIPIKVQRQVIYDAIVKLGGMQNMDQHKNSTSSPHFPPSPFLFEGELKMRSFQVPSGKKGGNIRNAFPIFVTQSDRDQLLEFAEKNNGEIKLPVVTNRNYGFDKRDWDGVVYVEKVKNAGNQNSRSSSSYCPSEHESDYQAINRSRNTSFENNDAFSNASYGSSNRLFQTPNPCATPNPIYTPGALTPNPLNIVTTQQVQYFSQPPSPFSNNSLHSPMMLPSPNLQNVMPPLPLQNFIQPTQIYPSQNQINPRLQNVQNTTVERSINACSGAQFVRDHGDFVQKEQKAQIEKILQTEKQADLD